MRPFYYDFQIDKKPILVPDADLPIDGTDLDSDESGRDEGGYMHRFVLREGVKAWRFVYADLTREEYRYMQSLFKGKPEFRFDFRDEETGQPDSCTAHRAKYGIVIHNAVTGHYKNYKFNIIQS